MSMTSHAVAERLIIKPGDHLTADVLETLRDQAKAAGDENVAMLVRFIEARRDDHVARMLFSRLLGKHVLDFARTLRSFAPAVVEPGTVGERMYLGVIDNFLDAWKGWLEEEPPDFEPSNVTTEFSPDGTEMHAKYVHWTASVVGAMLAESLLRPHNDPEKDRHVYFNNVTMTMTHSGQRFAVTLQRCDGETPAQQRVKAEALAKELEEVLRQVREAAGTYGHQLGCSSHEEDGSGCDCILSEMALVRKVLGQ